MVPPVVDGMPRSYLSNALEVVLLNEESKNLSFSKSFMSLSAVAEADVEVVPSAEGYPDPASPVDPEP